MRGEEQHAAGVHDDFLAVHVRLQRAFLDDDHLLVRMRVRRMGGGVRIQRGDVHLELVERARRLTHHARAVRPPQFSSRVRSLQFQAVESSSLAGSFGEGNAGQSDAGGNGRGGEISVA